MLSACQKQETTTLKVGVSPVVSSAGIFIALEKGYFKKMGLENVEVTYFKESGAPMTALLAKNELHVGGGNISSGLWNAVNQGVPIKIVADKGHSLPGRNYIALLVRTDHVKSGRYKGPKDLKGFKMGLTALVGVSQQIVTDRFLKSAGLSMSDVTFIKMSYAEMNLAFKNKELDATVQIEPYVTLARIEGSAEKVADTLDVYPNQQSAGIFYSPLMQAELKEAGVKFMAAYILGVRDYNAAFIENKNKNEIIRILNKHIKIEDDRVWNEMIPVGLSNNGQLNLNSLRQDIKWYHENKFIEKEVDLDAVVDHSYIDNALQLIKDQ